MIFLSQSVTQLALNALKLIIPLSKFDNSNTVLIPLALLSILNMLAKCYVCLTILLLICSIASGEQLSEFWLNVLPPGTKYRTQTSPPPLPALKSKSAEIDANKNENSHFGGLTNYDPMGISNNTFNFMMGGLAVKSLIDVGCGKGISAKYFYDQGVKVLCVDGLHEAVNQTVLPRNRVVEHDFSRGPWWPAETFDAAWSVEFVEHVGRQYMENYLPIFHKSAFIFMSGSGFGGWHHVEVR